MKFDIKDFYPNISKKLLDKALEFASNYETVTTQEKSIICNAAKSILVNKEEIWTKQSTSEKGQNSLILQWAVNMVLR